MTDITLDLEDIFPFLLDNISVYTYCKEVMATILFLAPKAPRTFLVVLVLFWLALVDRRLWVLATRYVNRRSISGFSLFGVFFFLFCRPVPLETLSINLLVIRG